MDLGITSASSVLLSKALSAQVGIKIPSTFTFDNPTRRSMMNSLSKMMGRTSGRTTSQQHFSRMLPG
jgi:hypothetical protein